MTRAVDSDERGRLIGRARGATVSISGRWFLPLLILSAFGPYLSLRLPIRTEHVYVFLLMVIGTAKLLLQKGVGPNSREDAPFYILYVSIGVWTIFGTLMNIGNYDTFRKMISYFVNYLEPLAIVVCFMAFYRHEDLSFVKKSLFSTADLIILLLCVNTFFALASLVVNTYPLMKHFVGPADATGSTVWLRAIENGRFTGIFDQPINSGISYSFGMLLWAYLVKKRKAIRARDVLALFLLFLGGTLSVSKAFILGGVPIFYIYLFSQRRLVHTVARITPYLIVASVLMISLLAVWRGRDYLLRFLSPGSDVIGFITGSRFGGSSGTVTAMMTHVLQASPLYGFGFGSTETLDSAYSEYLYQGGIVGLILYLCLLVWMGRSALKWRKQSDEGMLLLFIVIFTIGAGLGGPILDAGRFRVLYWSIFLLLTQYRKLERMGGPLPLEETGGIP
jgi:hypothetical protein